MISFPLMPPNLPGGFFCGHWKFFDLEKVGGKLPRELDPSLTRSITQNPPLLFSMYSLNILVLARIRDKFGVYRLFQNSRFFRKAQRFIVALNTDCYCRLWLLGRVACSTLFLTN